MLKDIRRALKKMRPHLLQAKADNLNEADTVQRLIRFFEEVLGYDLITEISREAQLKNKYVDIALKVDGVTRLLVEAKAAGVTMRDRHIEQAQAYASRNNFRWVVLTNGVMWNLYHLTFEEGIEYEKAFSIDLAMDNVDACATKLAYLHRSSIKKGDLDEFWSHCQALSPASIGRALFHVDVLRPLRRVIRRSEGILIDQEDLATALNHMLSPEARELIGPPKIQRRKPRHSNAAQASAVPRGRSPKRGPAPTSAV